MPAEPVVNDFKPSNGWPKSCQFCWGVSETSDESTGQGYIEVKFGSVRVIRGTGGTLEEAEAACFAKYVSASSRPLAHMRQNASEEDRRAISYLRSQGYAVYAPLPEVSNMSLADLVAASLHIEAKDLEQRNQRDLLQKMIIDEIAGRQQCQGLEVENSTSYLIRN